MLSLLEFIIINHIVSPLGSMDNTAAIQEEIEDLRKKLNLTGKTIRTSYKTKPILHI